MALFSTEAVILRSYDLKDADRIVVFLTREFGLIRGVAKGAKKLKSRFGGSLEPVSVVDLVFFRKENRDLASINSVEILKAHFDIASDPDFQLLYSEFVSLILDFVPPDDTDERIFRMLVSCIDAYASDNEKRLALEVYFQYWILKFAGYLPSWGKCDGCGGVQIKGGAYLQPDFTLSCSEHANTKSIEINLEAREVFSLMRKLSPKEFLNRTVEFEMGLETIDLVLKRLISRVLDREASAMV